MKSQLEQLQNFFSLYQPFWREWLRYKHCKLSQREVTAINFLSKGKFRRTTCGETGFSVSMAEIQNLTAKLKRVYNHYQEWAILRFQFVILSYMYNDGKKIQPSVGIKNLPIDTALIKILQKFKSKTLDELVDTYTDKEFKNELIFAHILKFMARYLKLNPITHEPAGV